jgi:hypothetical protein
MERRGIEGDGESAIGVNQCTRPALFNKAHLFVY